MTPSRRSSVVVELDDLGVEARIVGADRLDRDLPMFPVAAFLRRGIAVHRREGVELLRLRLTVQAVLDVRPADGRGRLGTQGERPAAPVLERVHLLLHDVGARARRPLEERGVLEYRGLDPAVAVERTESLRLADHPLPERLVGRENVVRPARSLDLHGSAVRTARRAIRRGTGSSRAPGRAS